MLELKNKFVSDSHTWILHLIRLIQTNIVIYMRNWNFIQFQFRKVKINLKKFSYTLVVNSQKLGLRKKSISLLLRIAILLLEGSFEKKDYFSWKKFETQNNNFIFAPTFLYRFEPNFKKWCHSNKSKNIFSGKRFSTTWTFPIFEIEFIIIKYSNLFIKISFWKMFFNGFSH